MKFFIRSMASIIFMISWEATLFAATFDEISQIYSSGQYEEARTAFLDFIQQNPGDPKVEEVEFYTVACLYGMGDYQAYESEISEFETKYPGSTFLHSLAYYQAMIPYHKFQWRAAVDSLQRFMIDHPESSHVVEACFHGAYSLYQIGCVDGDFGEFELAVADFQAEHPNSPHLSKLQYSIAMIPYHQRKWEEAIPKLNQFIETYPEFDNIPMAKFHAAHALYQIGSENGEFGEFERAVADFQTEHPDSPHLVKLQYNMATVPYHQKDWDETITRLNDFVTSHTGALEYEQAKLILAHSHIMKAKELEEAGDSVGAAQYHELGQNLIFEFQQYADEYLHLDPKDRLNIPGDLEYMRLESWFFKGDYQTLEQKGEEYILRHPDDPKAFAEGMIAIGVAKINHTPRDLNGAAEAFDIVLETIQPGISPEVNELLTMAAHWRAGVALSQGDKPKALTYALKIRNEMPYCRWKTTALRSLNWLLEEYGEIQ